MSPGRALRPLAGVMVAFGALVGGYVLVRAGQEGSHMAKPSGGSEQDAAPQCPLPLSDQELKKRLTAEQYQVTRKGGTERPFANAYWNNKKPGLYVDVITGEPLFVSTDKFDSRTGWPSFTKPITPERVEERTDTGHGTVRTEVRAKGSGSHLGHVFEDGPAPTGQRYCINSAALRFIPWEDLEQAGYGQYRSLFTDTPSAH